MMSCQAMKRYCMPEISRFLGTSENNIIIIFGFRIRIKGKYEVWSIYACKRNEAIHYLRKFMYCFDPLGHEVYPKEIFG